MSINHSKNIIELRHIFFSFTPGDEVLHDINLDIHEGDYLGIIGPNGGGKTTLLKIMLGLLKPDKGSVRLFGQEISHFNDWSKIGYVAQKAVNFDSNYPLTVEEIVAMGRYGKKGLFRMIDKNDKMIIKESLNHVEMWNYRSTLIGDLSGGQQQRVFIARALASKPEAIFLDEPTVGVDEKTQKQFYALLRSLNQKLNLTLIFITHDMNIVTHEATEIACVNKTLVYDKYPKKFLEINQFHNH